MSAGSAPSEPTPSPSGPAPASPRADAEGPRADAPAAVVDLGGVAVAAGVGLAAGLAVPLAWGVAPALLFGLGAALLIARRGPGAPEPATIAALPPARRLALAGLLLAPIVPLATVAARAIGGVVVAYPAALWVAAPAVLAALAPRLVRGTWSQALVLFALVLGTVGAGAWGARFEAAGPHARGETWGGPILGIHPFQATAVIVDGYGPFDLPINDYVEPDGSRGYGPEALAEALTRDLRAIAEQQFAEHGPAQAYRAFAEAAVVAEELPEARERLDRPSERDTEPRLHAISGGVGRRSRVEFVCPGAQNDPRPREPDAVMQRMCPDKYSSEASAGLGLTGRWTGYAEVLGQPRLSLARALGWPRERVFTELRVWAWIALGLVFVTGLGRRGRAAQGLARWGGAVALVAAVLSILLLLPGLSVQVEAWTRPAPWESATALAPWVALMALGSCHAALAGAAGQGGAGRRVGLRAAPILAGTLGLACSLAASTWFVPELAPPRELLDPLPFEAAIAGLADALHRGAGLGVGAAEGIVAAVVVATLVGLLAALLGPVVRTAGAALAPRRPALAAHLALAAVIVPAAGLVLSRMTAGGAVLLAPAAAMAWMAGSGLALVGAGGRRWLAVCEHLLAAAVVVAAGLQVHATHANRMTKVALALAALITLAGLILVRPVRSASDLGRPPPRP